MSQGKGFSRGRGNDPIVKFKSSSFFLTDFSSNISDKEIFLGRILQLDLYQKIHSFVKNKNINWYKNKTEHTPE